MHFRRSFLSALIAISMVGSTAPTYAFDGAGFGVGLGLGLLGGALAGANRPHYYYAPRYGYAPRYAYTPRHHRAAPPPAAIINVATNSNWEMRTFWNCQRPDRVFVSAQAQHGYVKTLDSTRFVCGNPHFPVKEIVYLSQTDYHGPDTIVFFDRGRRTHVDNIMVGDYNIQMSAETNLTMAPGEERNLLVYENCTHVAMQATATNGFANVREMSNPGTECNGSGKTTEKVVYKAPSGFTGTDTVVVDSDTHSPIEFTIEVGGDTPKVSEYKAPEKETPDVMPEAEASTEQKALEKLLDSPGKVAATPDDSAAKQVAALAPDKPSAPAAAPAPAPDSFPTADIRGNCRMDNCNFFRLQNVSKVGSTGNGELMKADMFSWGATYADKPNEYDNPPTHVSEKAVEQSYMFCSKTRPIAFYRVDNQWFSRQLRPGDRDDVNNANYNRYVEYWAVCHHQIITDPYNIADAPSLGYHFAAIADDQRDTEKKVNDPADMLK